ncbi:MAG: hypothetical protein IKR57_05770 [Bacilli bacterium]|nr:hypothetical protein [Bacilli bacterium]
MILGFILVILFIVYFCLVKFGGGLGEYLAVLSSIIVVGVCFLFVFAIVALIAIIAVVPTSRHNPLVGIIVFFLLLIIMISVSIFLPNKDPIRNTITYKNETNTYYINRFNNQISVIKFKKDNMELIYELFDRLCVNSNKNGDCEINDSYTDNDQLIIDSIINKDERLLKNYKKDN